MDWKSHITTDEARELEQCKADESRISETRRKIRKRAWARAIKDARQTPPIPGAEQRGEQ